MTATKSKTKSGKSLFQGTRLQLQYSLLLCQTHTGVIYSPREASYELRFIVLPYHWQDKTGKNKLFEQMVSCQTFEQPSKSKSNLHKLLNKVL